MQLVLLDTVDSTQAEARRRWQDGTLATPAVVVARAQTAGRGTSGRSWCSPHGAGLYVSILDRPAGRPGPSLRGLVLAGAFATAEWMAERFGVQAAIKPLNDLYALGRKLGGVLVEVHAEEGQIGAAITGIGVNLTEAPRGLPDGMSAVSLAELGVAETAMADLPAMAHDLAGCVIGWNERVQGSGHDILAEVWTRFGLPGAVCPVFDASEVA